MKAVVLEIRKKQAAVLCSDGQILKIKQKNYQVGDTIEISEPKSSESIFMSSKKLRYGSAAAAAALFLLGSGGIYSYNTAFACSYVSVDINPSIEFVLNRQNKVLEVTALNEDADEIVTALEKNNINKNTLSQALEKTSQILEECGYISDSQTDYILVNISSDSEKRRAQLKKEADSVFTETGNDHQENINCTITESTISQRKKANELGISSGEYAEIQSIKKKNNSSGESVEADDIKKYGGLKVKDLLEVSGTIPQHESSDTGPAEDTGKITDNKKNQNSNSSTKNNNEEQNNSSSTDNSKKQNSSSSVEHNKEPINSNSTDSDDNQKQDISNSPDADNNQPPNSNYPSDSTAMPHDQPQVTQEASPFAGASQQNPDSDISH